ncbi:MAG: alpha/beta hydrolase [Erythrobacter sp.]
MKWLVRIALGLLVVLVAAFLIFRTPDTDADAMRAKYGGEPSQFVELPSGQTVHLRDEGPRDARAIILLHGSSADLHTWSPWVAGLKADYRVVRIDHIGHGLTGPSITDEYALVDFVATVDGVADHLKLDEFVIGGNSMGGWISVGYAMKHADRVEGLVLVDASGAPIKRESGGGNLGFTIASIPVVNQIMTQITPRSLVERSLRDSVSNTDIVTKDAVDRYWELLRYPGNRAATIERFGTPRVEYSKEDIAKLGKPTLILWGEEDQLTPLKAGKWYHQHLPSSQFIAYAGIGHLPHEEAPEQSLADLREWLETVPNPNRQQTEDTEQ